jgi:hypothetical protein
MTSSTSRFDNKRLLLTIAFAIAAIYFLPYIFLGERARITVHDNLDSNVTWVKIMLDNNLVFSSPTTPINQIFNGIPRSSLYGYDISLLWFKLTGMYWGYVINKILMTAVAFAGMYYLLKKHFLPKDSLNIIPVGVALTFALLPFWSFTMTVCGLPLVLYAFLNIRNRNYHYSNWLIIALFPFYSSLILSGLFFLIVLTLILIYDTVKAKAIPWYFLLAIALMSVLYVVSHFPLFYSFFYTAGYVSHRVEFTTPPTTLAEAFTNTFSMLTLGQYHAHSLHTLILIPIIFGFYLLFKSGKVSKRNKFVILYIILVSLLYGFLDWNIVGLFKKHLMPVLPVKLQRFHFLNPMFWYVLFGVSLYMISKRFTFGKNIVVVILVIQLGYVFTYQEVFYNRKGPSYRKFYATDLFSNVKSFIKDPPSSYRIISVGIHPSIAQYNGFYTLDGYFPDYPLTYKHQFKKIIAPEVKKSKKLNEYFETFGSRCYAFSSELERHFVDPKPKPIQHLDYDYDAFKQMGGKYIVSSAEINTVNNKRLKLLKVFTNKNSYWKIYLYGVI